MTNHDTMNLREAKRHRWPHGSAVAWHGGYDGVVEVLEPSGERCSFHGCTKPIHQLRCPTQNKPARDCVGYLVPLTPLARELLR